MSQEKENAKCTVSSWRSSKIACVLKISVIAVDLLPQIKRELQTGIIIIIEQYLEKDTTSWFAKNLGAKAIWIPEIRLAKLRCGYIYIC